MNKNIKAFVIGALEGIKTVLLVFVVGLSLIIIGILGGIREALIAFAAGIGLGVLLYYVIKRLMNY